MQIDTGPARPRASFHPLAAWLGMATLLAVLLGLAGTAPAADARQHGATGNPWSTWCVRYTPGQLARMPQRLAARCRPIRQRAARRGALIFTPHAGGHLPTRRVRWHGERRATWYGPGFYGRRTACGTRLDVETWGIAHPSLPCGTMVAVSYRGRQVAVPVLDRGPFSGAHLDLTGRVRTYLGFNGTDIVRFGVLPRHSLPRHRL